MSLLIKRRTGNSCLILNVYVNMAEVLALKKIDEGEKALTQLSKLSAEIQGLSKLRKRVEAEIKYLKKGLQRGGQLKENHVTCSNLGQLIALCEAVQNEAEVCGVLQMFTIHGSDKLVVDVVAQKGKKWSKVIMRNPKALHLLYVMGGRDGVKPLDEVADDFLVCAELHAVFYAAPKVNFLFASGVSESLAECLEDKGINVEGRRIPDQELNIPDYSVDDSSDDSDEDSECSQEYCEDSVSNNQSAMDNRNNGLENNAYNQNISNHLENSVNVEINYSSHSLMNNQNNFNSSSETNNADIPSSKINLDVTSMIAYVTSTANGGANFVFVDKFLTDQAEWERKNPILKVLDGYFEGKELITCQEAVDHFKEIVETIGGPGEKDRAQQLLKRINIIPGQDVFKDKVKLGGRVRELSRIIFGTGHSQRAITVTSNQGFVRSAGHQNVKLAVYFHEPRALTEAKEGTATPLT
ncbi:unnamed protein product, partial [Meganyctiphanes norvegica]